MKTHKRLNRVLALLTALIALNIVAIASAHPLGNFTISRYSAITLHNTSVDVDYIIDMAEIPAFQTRSEMDTNNDGVISTSEESSWADATVAELAGNLILHVDGSSVPLVPTYHTLNFPPGQGDLETLRLEVSLSSTLPAVAKGQQRAIIYEDQNFSDRPGWQEIVVKAADGSLAASSVPSVDISNRLRDYPSDLLLAPPAINYAEFSYDPAAMSQPESNQSGRPIDSVPAATSPVDANRFSQDEFANLLNRTLDTPGALIAALLVAVGLGAAHALTPGHGKTIVGAYLVGSRGTGRHALFLGLTTTITHTAGVFVLGFIVLAASEYVLPEMLYPWLGVLSGLLVAIIGLSIFRGHAGHWLAHRRGQTHDHGHYHFHFGKGHSHSPLPAPKPVGRSGSLVVTGTVTAAPRYLAALAQPHTHDHPHHSHGHLHNLGEPHHSLTGGSEQAAASDSLSWRNLLALGISGGLLPCPSALILMLSAIALRQVGLGLLLILAFSIGLAGVLSGIGLLMVYAGRFLERLPVRHSVLTARFLPAASAAFITIAGLAITWRALGEAGVF